MSLENKKFGIADIANLSERDLHMLIEPGIEIAGFETVEEADALCTQIALAVLGDSLDEEYPNYNKGILTLGTKGPLDAVIKRRRGNRKSADITYKILTPIRIQFLQETKDGISNPENVQHPIIRMLITGKVLSDHPSFNKALNTNSLRTITLHDEALIFTRLRRFGTGETKPYLVLRTKSLDKIDKREEVKKIEESSQRWKNAMIRGIRLAYSGGAFGQGKRS